MSLNSSTSLEPTANDPENSINSTLCDCILTPSFLGAGRSQIYKENTHPESRATSRSTQVTTYMGWKVPFSSVCSIRMNRAEVQMLPPVHRSTALQNKIKRKRKVVAERTLGDTISPTVQLDPLQQQCVSDSMISLMATMHHSKRKAVEQQIALSQLRRSALTSFLRSGGNEQELALIIEDLDTNTNVQIDNNRTQNNKATILPPLSDTHMSTSTVRLAEQKEPPPLFLRSCILVPKTLKQKIECYDKKC
jgi:hypothetical protein